MWQAAHLIADISGIGTGLVDWLSARLGRERVTGYRFNQFTKATLGAKFLAVIETGRFHYWAGQNQGDEADKFFAQAANCSYALPPGGSFERDLRWGGWNCGHDDRQISAALVANYDDLILQGKVTAGKAESAVIEPADIFEGESW
jgi:hypothetical protein